MGKFKKQLQKQNKIKKNIIKETKELNEFFIETKKKYMEIDPQIAERLLYIQEDTTTVIDPRLCYE